MERQLNYNLARMSFVVHVMGKFAYIFEFSGCLLAYSVMKHLLCQIFISI